MTTASAAARHLLQSFKRLQKEPVDGVAVEVENENMFEWKIWLEGPKDSPYEGGIFSAIMSFPDDFPMAPPSLKFLSEFWHPNVYDDGRLCISILHPPGDDPMSGESAFERWLPVQSVETVLLSVISLLGEPNASSPANVDAGVMWRNNRSEYVRKCKRLVEKANAELPADGVKIPHPDTVRKMPLSADEQASMADYYYDDYEDYYQDDSASDQDADEGEEH